VTGEGNARRRLEQVPRENKPKILCRASGHVESSPLKLLPTGDMSHETTKRSSHNDGPRRGERDRAAYGTKEKP